MAVMGVGFCLSFAVAMPFLTKTLPHPRDHKLGPYSHLASYCGEHLCPFDTLQWYLALPISVATAVSFGALFILFTDLATEDTKGR